MRSTTATCCGLTASTHGTAEGKAQLAAIAESGIEILTPDDFALITGMADSFRRHPISADLFAAPHKVEQSIFAEINGVRCKCRPDYISGDFIMDVKTTRRQHRKASANRHGISAITSRKRSTGA